MEAIILAVAGLVFAYIASWALIGGEIMDYRAFVWDNTQQVEDDVEVMLVEHVTNMLDIIESELRNVMEELKHIEGISEIDDAKTKLGKILDGLY